VSERQVVRVVRVLDHEIFCRAGEMTMSNNLVPFPGAANADETARKTRLYEWADNLLMRLGVASRVKQAMSVEELHKVTFDPDAIDVLLAIREALQPASGRRAGIFDGLGKDALKRILKARFNDLKRDRAQQLLRGHGAAGGKGGKQSAYNWTDDLKLDDKGGVKPLLANLILFLRNHPKWKDVLAYDEFNARVVVRKRPPWGDEPRMHR